MDKYWNVTGGGQFFNISDLKFVHFRSEKDDTYTVTYEVGTVITGNLYGKDKNSALAFSAALQKWKIQYQIACKKHDEFCHGKQQEMIKNQDVAIKLMKKSHCK